MHFLFSFYFLDSFVVGLWCRYCVCFLYPFNHVECLYVYLIWYLWHLIRLVFEFASLHLNSHPLAIQFTLFTLLFASIIYNHRFQTISNHFPNYFCNASQTLDPTSSYFQKNISNHFVNHFTNVNLTLDPTSSSFSKWK